MPVSTQIQIDDLTFGIEIECILPRNRSRSELAAALSAAGVAASEEVYNHFNRPTWKLVTDGSLSDYVRGTEVVSPVLRGEEGFAQLRTAMRVIDEFGCTVNRSCGFHVHVGVRDTTHARVGFFKELLRTYEKFEPIIDQLMAPSRRQSANTYCQPVRTRSTVLQAKNVDELRTAYGRGERYKKVNLEAFWRHGTVEFRQHQGTVNAQKAENWVRLCLRLVVHAAKNDEADVATVSRFDNRPRDLDRSPLVPHDQLTRSALRHRLTSSMIIRRPTYNPRRPGTRGHDNFNLYRDGMSLRALIIEQGLGVLTHLRYDVEHLFVRVLDTSRAPVLEVAAEAPVTTPTEVHRPDTDQAPRTLDGLMDLINASPAERSFFAERQLELNA